LATTAWDELKYLRAREMMTKNVVTIGPDETMQEAQDQMSTYNFRHLPIVENDRIIGMLSLRDTLAVRWKEAVSEINLLRDVVAASRHA
jgi:CBS domain-containing protein